VINKFKFKYWKVRHYFIEQPQRPFEGNLADFGNCYFIKKNWFKGVISGSGRGCSDTSKGQRELRIIGNLYFLGPFFIGLNVYFGWIAKYPEMGFSNHDIGIKIFNHMFTIGRAYNFSPTKSGKKSVGIEIHHRILEPYVKEETPDLEHPLINRVVIDPHKKGKLNV